MLYEMIGFPFLYNFALRKFDFKGQGSVTPKNGGGGGAVKENSGADRPERHGQ